jgi:hypothetical protein
MGARAFWIVVAGMLLFSGCKGCKKEGGEQPPAAPAAGEPQKTEAPRVDAGAEPVAEAAAPDAAAAEKPKRVVKHTVIEMPEVTREEMNDPSFPKKLTPQARKAIIRLRKLQQTDPRFKRDPTGVPTPPPEDEHGVKRPKRRKKRNK